MFFLVINRKNTFCTELCLRFLVSAAFFFVIFLLIEYLAPKCSILKGRFLEVVICLGREGMMVLEIKIK
ncbi:hypothetical protein BA1_10231 [Bacillus xiamenensis]|nr:hypothetical protein BA1_10231 [Bacillus xiamenensis]